MRSKLVIGVAIGFVISVLFSAGAITLAGMLDPASGPTAADSQMYTLQQIYARLTSGAAGTKMTAFTEPSSGPGTGTMVTLDQIMAAAPVTHTNAATQTYVVSGTVAWGLSGDAWGVIMGARPYLPLFATGVITCSRSVAPWETCECGTENCPAGQDGALQMGFAPLESRFTVISGTVRDNMTGLVWLRNANCPGTNRNWAQAFVNVAQLNATGIMTGTDGTGRDCGDTSNEGSYQTDWRLPNARELHSLTDYGYYSPSLPAGHPFLFVQSDWYWTSTPHGGGLPFHMQRAFFVDMRDGIVYHEDKTVSTGAGTRHLYVWPVRGGQ